MENILEILPEEKARLNFIKGLINLSKADEQKNGLMGINTEELKFLKNAMAALNLSEYSQREMENFVYSKNNIVDISFESKKQSLFFLREGMQICYIEGNYSQAERAMMGKMAENLGVSIETLNEIEEWVQEGISLSMRGEALLSLEG